MDDDSTARVKQRHVKKNISELNTAQHLKYLKSYSRVQADPLGESTTQYFALF